MKVLVVHIGDVLKCPPVLNLIHMLQDLNINTHLIFTKSEYIEKEKKCLSTFMLPCDYEQPRSLLEKLTNMLYLRRIIWNYLDENCGDEDVIWVTSDTALKHIGNKIINKRYILQFMELSEDIRYYNRLPIKMNVIVKKFKEIQKYVILPLKK